jgi:hypothetical protein
VNRTFVQKTDQEVTAGAAAGTTVNSDHVTNQAKIGVSSTTMHPAATIAATKLAPVDSRPADHLGSLRLTDT